jgi:hypothetical protein
MTGHREVAARALIMRTFNAQAYLRHRLPNRRCGLVGLANQAAPPPVPRHDLAPVVVGLPILLRYGQWLLLQQCLSVLHRHRAFFLEGIPKERAARARAHSGHELGTRDGIETVGGRG